MDTDTQLTSTDLSKRPGKVRQALNQGKEPEVKFHGKPYACVVLLDRRREERAQAARHDDEIARRDAELERKDAELERLRAENDAFRARFGEVCVV